MKNAYLKAAKEVLKNAVTRDGIGYVSKWAADSAEVYDKAEQGSEYHRGVLQNRFHYVGQAFCNNAGLGACYWGAEPPTLDFMNFVEASRASFAGLDKGDSYRADFEIAASGTRGDKVGAELYVFYGRLIVRGVSLRAKALQAQQG